MKKLGSFQAMLFDLDDTLLNRNQAVDNLFFLILERFYQDIQHPFKNDMLQKFKAYDKKYFGISDKTTILQSFFDEFPPHDRLPRHDMQDFWNNHFPHCFSVNPHTLNIIKRIKMRVKVGIITNGTVHRQKAKIMHTQLNSYFDDIIISEEVGYSKPDKRIFELALNQLHVQPEAALFVGDDIKKDIGGCQRAKIKGIWFNPHRIANDTNIKPYAEIHSLDQLVKGGYQ